MSPASHWTMKSALGGAALWTAVAIIAGIHRAPFGVIELLFLLAPLVIVPLGLELGSSIAPSQSALESAARRLQPFAAILVVAAFWLPPGPRAAIAVLPWFAVCGLIGLAGVLGLLNKNVAGIPSLLLHVGRLHLAIGGAWLVVSRLGAHPTGFQEPIILLTAVHFHYSGFGLSMIASTTLQIARERSWSSRLLFPAAVLAVFMPFVLAAGFVFSQRLKVMAAVILAVSVFAFAAELFRMSFRLASPVARAYLKVAPSLVFAGMALAAIYAVGDYVGHDWLIIPQVARTHGALNGPGFILLALL
ncbi:MAG TPA: YndJ family transporter, partial [Terriglobales bacterium]